MLLLTAQVHFMADLMGKCAIVHGINGVFSCISAAKFVISPCIWVNVEDLTLATSCLTFLNFCPMLDISWRPGTVQYYYNFPASIWMERNACMRHGKRFPQVFVGELGLQPDPSTPHSPNRIIVQCKSTDQYSGLIIRTLNWNQQICES